MTDEYTEVCIHPAGETTQEERIAALEAECKQRERAVEYWQAQLKAERRKSADNLRLAAERATEISELQKQVKGMEAERDSLQRVIDGALDDIQARMGQRYNSLIDAYAALVLRYQEAERKVAKYERQQPMPGMTA